MKDLSAKSKLIAMVIVVAVLAAVRTEVAMAQDSRGPVKVIVPSQEFRTIQQGIDAVADNGTVLIQPGIYAETLTVIGKRVRLVGNGARGKMRTEIVGARPTEVVSAERASGLVTYGPGGGGEIKAMMLRGGGAGILGVERDGGLPAPLVVKDMLIRGGERGILGRFFSLTVKDTEIASTLWNGISVVHTAGDFGLFDSFIHDAGGVGALIHNFGQEPFLGLTIKDTNFASNSAAGLVIFGGARAVSIESSLFSNNKGFGILLLETNATLVRDSSIIGTQPRLDDGKYGDGLVAALSGPVKLTNCLIATSARIGVSNFGSKMALRDNRLVCNLASLLGEELNGVPYTWDDLGGNQCSTKPTTGPCISYQCQQVPDLDNFGPPPPFEP